MKTLISTLRRNILSSINYSRVYSTRPARCDAHMNELPVPCGAWEPWYRERQSFYTKMLLFGLIWWAFSFSMAISSGALYLNWSPPAQPGPPSDFVEECDDSEN